MKLERRRRLLKKREGTGALIGSFMNLKAMATVIGDSKTNIAKFLLPLGLCPDNCIVPLNDDVIHLILVEFFFFF